MNLMTIGVAVKTNEKVKIKQLKPALLHGYVVCLLTVFGLPNLVNRFRRAALT